MNLHKAITQLQSQCQAIVGLMSGFTADEARWNPEPESWSALEVLCHPG